MNFLLDTNLISEWAKPRPNAGVLSWLTQADEDRLFISVATLAELRYGIERLPAGNRRKQLDDWLNNDLRSRFDSRILAVDQSLAHGWGRIVARSEAHGRPIGAIDALIAATAELHNLTLVTRNASDFQAVLTAIVNPWSRS